VGYGDIRFVFTKDSSAKLGFFYERSLVGIIRNCSYRTFSQRSARAHIDCLPVITCFRSKMVASIVLCIFVLLSVLSCLSADYVGAVAEHTVYQGTDAETSEMKLEKNIEIYEGLISLAAKNGVQVLVFPEFGLTPGDMAVRSDLYPYIEIIPEVATKARPCNDATFNDRPILQRISCAAQQNKQLVLINMIDNVACDISTDAACPSDNHYQYNTDVVFDESGTLIAKYHKSHEWPGLKKAYDQPVAPSEVTFTASFGVEFGLFICFDIMFEDPPKVLRANGMIFYFTFTFLSCISICLCVACYTSSALLSIAVFLFV
jgi:hypothetical protein